MPSSSRPVPPVPPGSTALREFCHAVISALTIPDATEQPGLRLADNTEDVAVLRLYRDRTRLVLTTMRRILADREIDDHDVMIFVASLREQITVQATESGDHTDPSS
jgi:hypothetical protein